MGSCSRPTTGHSVYVGDALNWFTDNQEGLSEVFSQMQSPALRPGLLQIRGRVLLAFTVIL